MFENNKEKIKSKISASFLQRIGVSLIVVGYICLVRKWAWVFWAVMTLTGIAELILIFVFFTTITAFVRNLFGKRVDTIILLTIIPLTWYLMGENAAGIWTLGLLSNHLFEVQPKNTNQ